MEEITTKLKENESLIIEAESFKINDTKGVEIVKDRVRCLIMLKDTIDGTFKPHIAKANELHKNLIKEYKGYVTPVEQAINFYSKRIGIYLAKLEEEAKKQEQEINAILGPGELPVLVNTEIPDDIKVREDFDIEITDPIIILQQILGGFLTIEAIEFKLGVIKKEIKSGKDIRGIKIIQKKTYKIKEVNNE